jgi:hydroxymethylglutaryl-CoA reductase
MSDQDPPLPPSLAYPSSRLPGFYQRTVRERHSELLGRGALDIKALETLSPDGGLDVARADKMIENCVGVFGLPIGLGLNFLINGRDYLIPMVVEEPSVVAAVSHIARLIRPHGGFNAETDESLMIAQIQVVDLDDLERASAILYGAEDELLNLASTLHPNLITRGGGPRSIEVRLFESPHPMLVLHLIIDCVDAMGANAVNTIAEGLAPRVEALTGGRVYLRILSNLADQRLARSRLKIHQDALATDSMSGDEVARGIVHAYQFAEIDPYRAATHNKGIMNGIDAVAIATGNDWRSVEAGAHAYAARSGQYRSLTRWWREDDYLFGTLELPLAVATVGGSTGVHPTVTTLRNLLRVESASELAAVMASVGLAQNMGALKALATEGIQRGHMTLHARSVALSAGATDAEVAEVARALVTQNQVKVERAREVINQLRGESSE